MLHRHRALLGSALACLLLTSGCDDGGEPDLAPIEVERVVASLLTRTDLWSVAAEPEGHPVRVGTLRGPDAGRRGEGTRPALILVPPSEVRIEVPPDLAGAELRFQTGVDRDDYGAAEGVGVGFEVLVDGTSVHRQGRSIARGTPLRKRLFSEIVVPLQGAREVVLRTELKGELETPPRAGFAEIELVRTSRVARGRASAERPNVVVILVDTLRADGLHTNGNPRQVSPAIDALAAAGTSFDAAYAPSSWTWPSTASLLTGVPPPEHGLYGRESLLLPDEHTTLAEAFQDGGWTTGAFSGNTLVSEQTHFDQGFEHFETFDWAKAPAIVDRAIAWLRERGPERFFLYLHLVDPHTPYRPDPDMAERFVGAQPEGYDEDESRALLRRLYGGVPEVAERLEEYVAHQRELYDAEVATMDRAVGRLLDELDASGRRASTLVCLTSDHGQEFLEHGSIGHGKQLYDESVRVPLILGGPGVPAGRRVVEPVENRHLAGSLLTRVGLEPPRPMRGVDLFASDLRTASEPIFLATGLGTWVDPAERVETRLGLLQGVRAGRHFLIVGRDEDGVRRLLFDLEADPDAHTDRTSDDPATAAELEAAIDRWWDEGRARAPGVIQGDAGSVELLRGLGYVEGE